MRRWWRAHDVAPVEPGAWVQRPNEPARRILFDLALITAITTVTVTIVLRLWDAQMRVPFTYSGDGLQYSRDAKVLAQTGWVQTTPRLGAPFGQEMYDFAISGDNGNYVLMRLIRIGAGDWALLLNLFFLLTFYTAAWAAYLCLRWLRCGRTSSIVCSVLFAFAPYHLARNSAHLMLSSYWVTPVAVLLAVRASSGVPLIARGTTRHAGASQFVRHHATRTAPWILLCMCCASFGSYYAVFGLITMAIASVAVAIGRRSIRPALCGASYSIAVAAMFLFNLLPNVLYRRANGVNEQVAQRQPFELDLYGLRLIQMLTPVPGQWFKPLDRMSADLFEGYPSEAAQYFGLVASAALLLLLGWFAVHVVRRDVTMTDDVRPLLAMLLVGWVLIATTGGLDWLLTLVGFTEIRGWNRVSILLMFVVLAWFARTVAPLARAAVRDSRPRAAAALVVAAAVMVFGLIDHGSADFVPNTRAYGSTFASDRAFFGQVEALLPEGAMVYQLPFRNFPEETATYGSRDYDLYRPFLQTNDLRWSYGGMRGRDTDWQLVLDGAPAEVLTRGVIAVGFQGFVIDRDGYPDRGQQLETDIGLLTGRSPIVSTDGRWSFFDLSGLEEQFGTADERAALADELLYHPRVQVVGCTPQEGKQADRFNWCGADGAFIVDDPRPDGQGTVLHADIVAPAGASTLWLDVDGRTTAYPIGPEPTSLDVPVPAGERVRISFSTDAAKVTAPGDPRDLRFQFRVGEVSR